MDSSVDQDPGQCKGPLASLHWQPVRIQELEQLIVARLRAHPPRDPALGRIASALGVTQPFLRQLGWGKRPIPRRHLDALARELGLAYDVRVTDLRTGEPIGTLPADPATDPPF